MTVSLLFLLRIKSKLGFSSYSPDIPSHGPATRRAVRLQIIKEFIPTKSVFPALSGRDFRLVGDELEGYRVLGHLEDHEDVVRRLPLHVDAIDLDHLK